MSLRASAVPRVTAGHAYRAFLGLVVCLQQGIAHRPADRKNPHAGTVSAQPASVMEAWCHSCIAGNAAMVSTHLRDASGNST